MTTQPVKVVVVVEGGLVQEVFCDAPGDVIIIDKDTEGSDDYTQFKIGRDSFEADVRRRSIEHKPDVVDQYWKQTLQGE